MVGAFVGLGFRDADRYDAEMEKAMAIARRLHATGGRLLIAAEGGDDRRRSEAGHVDEANGLTDEQWANLVRGLHDLADNLEPLGMKVVFHNHVGTYVETPAETARLLDETDPARVGWCLDVGHLAYGGGDSLAMLPAYGDRVAHIHLKDVDGDVLARARAGQWSFGQALKTFIFPALGDGIARVSEVVAALLARGYDGWFVLEQDTTPDDPMVVARHNREYLQALLAGVGSGRRERRRLMAGQRTGADHAGHVDFAELEELARRGRLGVIEAVAHSGAGHVGGPLSAMDLLVALYFRVLRIRPEEPGWPERDRFILSKGHSAIALYTVMALRGYFPLEELSTFDAADSRLQGRPDMLRLPGLDASTGSLGQGLAIGLGIAMGARRRGLDAHTFVMLGDGEIQEGQVWETVHVAPRYGAGNLTAIVDRNGMQQYGWPLEEDETHRGNRGDPWSGTDLRGAWESFGWKVLEIDGHDFGQILAACDEVRALSAGSVPTAILARTVKGRGLSFTEGRSEWHARVATPAEMEAARQELGTTPGAGDRDARDHDAGGGNAVATETGAAR